MKKFMRPATVVMMSVMLSATLLTACGGEKAKETTAAETTVAETTAVETIVAETMKDAETVDEMTDAEPIGESVTDLKTESKAGDDSELKAEPDKAAPGAEGKAGDVKSGEANVQPVPAESTKSAN